MYTASISRLFFVVSIGHYLVSTEARVGIVEEAQGGYLLALEVAINGGHNQAVEKGTPGEATAAAARSNCSREYLEVVRLTAWFKVAAMRICDKQTGPSEPFSNWLKVDNYYVRILCCEVLTPGRARVRVSLEWLSCGP